MFTLKISLFFLPHFPTSPPSSSFLLPTHHRSSGKPSPPCCLYLFIFVLHKTTSRFQWQALNPSSPYLLVLPTMPLTVATTFLPLSVACCLPYCQPHSPSSSFHPLIVHHERHCYGENRGVAPLQVLPRSGTAISPPST